MLAPKQHRVIIELAFPTTTTVKIERSQEIRFPHIKMDSRIMYN